MKKLLYDIEDYIDYVDATDPFLTIAAGAVMLFFVLASIVAVLLIVRKKGKTITVPAIAGTLLHLAMMVMYMIPGFTLYGILSYDFVNDDFTLLNIIPVIADNNCVSFYYLIRLAAIITFVSLGFFCWLYCALTGRNRFMLLIPLFGSLFTAAMVTLIWAGISSGAYEGLTCWLTVYGKVTIAVSAADFIASAVSVDYMSRKKRAAKKAAAALAEGNQTEENKTGSGE